MFDLLCQDSMATLFGFLDPSIAPSLLYYAYVPVALSSLVLGVLVLRSKASFNLPNRLFFLITICFSFYILNEILLWILVPASLVHFGWVIVAIFFSTLPLLMVYFFYTFVDKKDLTISMKFLLASSLVPVLVLLPTSLNMGMFNLAKCESDTGILYTYIYILMSLSAFFVLILGLKRLITKRRVDDFLLAAGISIMIMSLLFSDLLSLIWGGAYEVNLVGPIGMLVLLVMLGFLIVKYKAFNIKLAAAQALVVGLVFLIGSLFFFAEGTTDYVLITITFVLASIGGYYLVKSVKKEIKQREEIELLAMRLEVANERVKELDKMKSEFVSIASHQLRGPITSIRGYASMLVEGSYGKLPERAKEVLEKLVESSKFMALSIEDYLNVSRIEAGNMKYELSDFNLREIAEKVVDEMRPVAMKKGLVLVYRSDTNGSNMVHADIGKTRQVIMNLIDNSIKYTPKGTITVVAHDDMKSKLMCITIQDTGIGMSKDTIEGMFDKFVRAKNANSVNVTGTGLGLFVAKKMIVQMNGRVWAESEGEGLGSTFHIELPLLSGKAGR